MKDGLVPGHGLRKLRYLCVLILVVVEDGLVRTTAIVVLFHSTSLNPYCNGRWSRTIHEGSQNFNFAES